VTLCLMTEVAEQEVSGATSLLCRAELRGGSCKRAAHGGGRSFQPRAAAAATQRAFSSAYFRAYTHTDVIGVESVAHSRT